MSVKKIRPYKKSKKSKTSDIKWNRFMETLNGIKEDADKKLGEISAVCLNQECNDKQR